MKGSLLVAVTIAASSSVLNGLRKTVFSSRVGMPAKGFLAMPASSLSV